MCNAARKLKLSFFFRYGSRVVHIMLTIFTIMLILYGGLYLEIGI